MTNSHPFALHLCATCTECNLKELCATEGDLPALRKEILHLVGEAGFSVVKDSFHFFCAHGVTGAVCLAESHVCFHSWPENNLVYVDVFACSRTRDPRQAIEKLMGQFASKIFRAGHVEMKWVVRN